MYILRHPLNGTWILLITGRAEGLYTEETCSAAQVNARWIASGEVGRGDTRGARSDFPSGLVQSGSEARASESRLNALYSEKRSTFIYDRHNRASCRKSAQGAIPDNIDELVKNSTVKCIKKYPHSPSLMMRVVISYHHENISRSHSPGLKNH